MRLTESHALLLEGVASGVFATADAAVMHRGQLMLLSSESQPVGTRLFDLASVTKVMSTTALTCHFIARGLLNLEQRVDTVIPDAAAGDRTVADLLTHRSGLPAFVPFFDRVLTEHPELTSAQPLVELRHHVRDQVSAAVRAVAPVNPVGQAAVYSDVGFLLLGQMLEKVGGGTLDALFAEHVARPLQLRHARFLKVSERQNCADTLVPTQWLRPREPAPGQEGLWLVRSVDETLQAVDDDNAFVMNGVAGHAGLFATATDVAHVGQAVLEGRISLPGGWPRDAKTPGSTRTFGFDTPSETLASCGSMLGDTAPGAIGHLGFTGTSLWVDFHRELVVVLLTNRTHAGRANIAIREFRRRFHDTVAHALR